MIDVDMENTDALIIVVDDGHRTTLTLAHQDGAELLAKLTEFYGRVQYGHGTDERPEKKGFIQRLLARFSPQPGRKS